MANVKIKGVEKMPLLKIRLSLNNYYKNLQYLIEKLLYDEIVLLLTVNDSIVCFRTYK